MDNTGKTWTYINNRGCSKGSLTPLWRVGENAVDGPGPTHIGLGIPDVRDQIHFARAYGEGVVFTLRSRADYIRIEPHIFNNGEMEYRFHVWANLGGEQPSSRPTATTIAT